MRKSIFVKSGVADGNPIWVWSFQISQGSKMLLWTFPSVVNLFQDHSFYKKVNFCQKWSCRQDLPLGVRDSNFADRDQTFPSFTNLFLNNSFYVLVESQILVQNGVAEPSL